MIRSHVVCLVCLFLIALAARAQEVSFLSLPPGYADGSVWLGAGNYATALAADPSDQNFIYVAGTFEGSRRIVRLNVWSGQRTSVFSCPTSLTISGFDVLNARAIFISDNWQQDGIFMLLDTNPQDGDFDDPGELRELITPILTNPGGDWTGSAVLAVPSGSASLRLPPNTVLFQSEDGGTTGGEVLAVVDSLSTAGPSYQPPGAAYFSGFNYGGGLALDSFGRLVVASSFYPETGKIWICEDLNQNGSIGPGESNILVARASGTTEPAGLSAPAMDSHDRCYVSVGMGFGPTACSEIRRFTIPSDPLHTTAPVTTFGILNSPYVSAAIFNTKAKSFEPSARDGAVMILVAYDPFFGNLDYLLTVRPYSPLRASRWQHY